MATTLVLTLAASALFTMTLTGQSASISAELAEHRSATLGNLSYELAFELKPGTREVTGTVEIRFSWTGGTDPVVLDFSGTALDAIEVNGQKAAAKTTKRVHDHIVIDPKLTRPGRNWIRARFKSRVAATGTPLTVYADKTDGTEYYYTLLVPADAHGLFPCFDQPDLKALFSVKLTVPADWTCVANAPPRSEPVELEGDRRVFEFDCEYVLPTYLFAFAAGPFDVVTGPKVGRPMRILVRKSKRPRLEVDRIFDMHKGSVAWYEEWFDHRYPFAKLDVVLCPGFPYGGMEHAGAIFYRESAIVFDHDPSQSELFRRSTLIYHEVAHQWFGNLVTMRWFDDLWLKEGFATFMSYKLLEDREPELKPWLRFHQRVKPAAYRVDVTRGTVPIWQRLGNLSDAKSNYGPIVYNKAPAILRELEARIGQDVFRAGVRLFLQRFPYNSATWQDLFKAYTDAGAKGLDRWSGKWITSAGMPWLRVRYELDAKRERIRSFAVTQGSAQGLPASAWPVRVELLVDQPDGGPLELSVDADSPLTEVKALIGKPAPRWVLLNPSDIAYGQFLLDEQSALALPSVLIDRDQRPRNALTVAVAFRALLEMTREAELEPAQLAQVTYALLVDEHDALTHASLLGTATLLIDRWLGATWAKEWRSKFETLLRSQLTGGLLPGLELQIFRTLAHIGRDSKTLGLLRGLRDATLRVAGLELGDRDRFLAAAALLAAGEPNARARLDALEKAAQGDVRRWAYEAAAAEPTAAAKARYFSGWLHEGDPPEQWISGSLGFFHWPGQEELTLPWLSKALEKLEWVKAHRRIFFMPSWINAFVGAHASPAALREVESFLKAHDDLPVDIRRKLLQATDGLRRAVRIRRPR